MKKFRVLTIDGGGARGTIAITKLELLEETLKAEKGKTLLEYFDMFARTSTGAIIAVMLTCGYSAKDIKDLYVGHGHKIFQKRFLHFGVFKSKYSDKYFNKVLIDYLGNRTLQSVPKGKHLLVPAYNGTTRELEVFKESSDKNRLLSDVVRASASAPTYFDAWLIDNQVYVDGGLVVNNPSMMCYVEALKLQDKLGEQFDIEILSVGTGRTEAPISESKMNKGALNVVELLNILLVEQTQTTDYFMQKLKNFDRFKYNRLECVIRKSSGKIDDFSVSNTKAMIEDGKLSYDMNSGEITRFLN